MGMTKVLVGFFVIWVVLDRSAALLGSFRGEAGVLVCLLVMLVATGVEFALFGMQPLGALLALGLRLATRRSMMATLALSALLLSFFPLYAGLAGVEVGIRDDWYWLLPGLFAQGGIAE